MIKFNKLFENNIEALLLAMDGSECGLLTFYLFG